MSDLLEYLQDPIDLAEERMQRAIKAQQLTSYTYFTSRYQFIKEHHGFRPGNMHLFMAAAGVGKSTLTRSIIADILRNNKTATINLLLSEESVSDFEREICRKENGTCMIDAQMFSRITASSELEMNYRNANLISKIGNDIKQKKHNFFIWDNITTSLIYNDKRPDDQAATVNMLKKMAENTQCAVIVIAHTGAERGGNSRLFEPNDIRGSKTIINITQFCYIMQRVIEKDVITTLLFIYKHRGQQIVNKTFVLEYCKMANTYLRDRAIGFESVKEFFKNRDKL